LGFGAKEVVQELLAQKQFTVLVVFYLLPAVKHNAEQF
jgi:hypothetical protein